MTPKQSMAARAFIGWERADLASHAQVSPTTVRNFERGMAVRALLVSSMQAALESAGIEFIGSDGVRLPAEREGK